VHRRRRSDGDCRRTHLSASVLTSIEGGVGRITLNRPEKRNALDRATIGVLTTELKRCAADAAVRVVQITGAGAAFCAGADLAEMQAQADANEADNLADAGRLATMLVQLDSSPKPTLARVNGDGYGGALGLLGACDIVVAADTAKFAFTEVRLGIIPAVISPFVLAKIGESAARRYFLTAETLSAMTLKKLGLVHEVVAAQQLDDACAAITQSLLKGAPLALAEAKSLIREMAHRSALDRPGAALDMAARLARLRVAPEAREGFSAFFAKRKASWRAE
jgi:methylglutaconyl-CoA hydratase